MSVEIPNGSVAICTCDITQTQFSLFSSPDSILAAIAQELVFDGLTIAQKSIGLSGLTFALTQEFGATIQIANQSGQELDDTDLASQFSDAVNTVGGLQINSFAVTAVVGAPTGVNSGTGVQGNVQVTAAGNAQQTQSSATGTPQCGDPALTLWQYPQQWFSCLTSKGLTTVGLVAIGLLIGVVLIVFVENKPRVTV